MHFPPGSGGAIRLQPYHSASLSNNTFPGTYRILGKARSLYLFHLLRKFPIWADEIGFRWQIPNYYSGYGVMSPFSLVCAVQGNFLAKDH
jgi:hypothetical protein